MLTEVFLHYTECCQGKFSGTLEFTEAFFQALIFFYFPCMRGQTELIDLLSHAKGLAYSY